MPTYVQKTKGGSNSTTTTAAATFASNLTVGNLVVVTACISGCGNQTDPSITGISLGTDTVSSIKVQDIGSSTAQVQTSIWAVTVATASQTVVTATVSGGPASVSLIAAEYSGYSFAQDCVANGASGTGTTGYNSGATGTRVNANSLLVSGIADNLDLDGLNTPTDGFTLEDQQGEGGTGSGKNKTGVIGLGFLDQIITGSTATHTAGCNGSGSVNWAGVIASFAKIPADPVLTGFVQQKTAQSAAATSIVVTLDANATVGNLVVVCSNNRVTSITGLGATWARVAPSALPPNAQYAANIWAGIVGSSSAAITLNAALSAWGVNASEWNGYADTVDQQNANESGTGTTVAPGSISTANANDLIVAMAVDGTNLNLFSPGSPWSDLKFTTKVASGVMVNPVVQGVSSTGSFNPTFTATGTITNSAAAIVALQKSGGTARAMAGTIAPASAFVQALKANRPLSGTAAPTSSVSPALKALRPLAAAAIASVSSIVGTLSVVVIKALAGTIASVSSIGSALAARRPIIGSAASTSTVSSTPLSVARRLIATLASVSGSAAALAARRTYAAAIASVSSVTAALARRVAFAGSMASASVFSAVIAIRRGLATALASVSTGAGTIARRAGLTGTLAPSSAVANALRVARALTAALASVSNFIASLDVSAPAQVAFEAVIASVSATNAALKVVRTYAGSMASSSSFVATLARRVGEIASLASASTVTAFTAIRRGLSTAGGSLSGAAGVIVRRAGIAGTLASSSLSTSALAVARPLNAALASVSNVIASLTVSALNAVNLAATIASTSSLTVALAVRRAIAGAAASVSSLTVSLAARRGLSTAVSSLSSSAAAIVRRAGVAGSVASSSVFGQAMAVKRALNAALASASNIIASLTVSGVAIVNLAATIASASAITTALAVRRSLIAAAGSASTFSTKLAARRGVVGAIGSHSTTGIVMRVARGMKATIASVSSFVIGTFTRFKFFVATLTSVSAIGAPVTVLRSIATLVSSASSFAEGLSVARSLATRLASQSAIQAVLFILLAMKPILQAMAPRGLMVALSGVAPASELSGGRNPQAPFQGGPKNPRGSDKGTKTD